MKHFTPLTTTHRLDMLDHLWSVVHAEGWLAEDAVGIEQNDVINEVLILIESLGGMDLHSRKTLNEQRVES